MLQTLLRCSPLHIFKKSLPERTVICSNGARMMFCAYCEQEKTKLSAVSYSVFILQTVGIKWEKVISVPCDLSSGDQCFWRGEQCEPRGPVRRFCMSPVVLTFCILNDCIPDFI